jgi:hypothetical protein
LKFEHFLKDLFISDVAEDPSGQQDIIVEEDIIEEEPENQPENLETTTRSGRVSRKPSRFQ